MHEIKPPSPIAIPPGHASVFLAGSIEMGRADDWQSTLSNALTETVNLTLLNPRREDWDASWKQSLDFAPFRQQVEWELDGLERADVIAMMLLPDTRAPISLLELGLFARSAKCIVCCPEGYWRKGNVDVVCARFGIEQVGSLDALARAIERRVAAVGHR